MKLILLLLPFSFFIQCQSEAKESEENVLVTTVNEEIPLQTEDHYTVETFQNEGLDWGYKILLNGQPFINQPHIPAVQGNKGFSTQEKAQITAEFALGKIEKGIIPPTITQQELDSLKVL